MPTNYINGWREVLARIFDGFEVEYGVTPDWLINPDTGRRLKLDYLFPQIGVAVRFVGLDVRERKQRKSDQELAVEAEREAARAAVCRAHGVTLLTIDPDGEPAVILRHLESGLARAAAQLAQNPAIPHSQKQAWMPLLSAARRRAGEFTRKLNAPERLSLYAEMWWERQANLKAQTPAQSSSAPTHRYNVGMAVMHERFGQGQVIAVEPEEGETKITVDFVGAGVRSFYAGLVGAKMWPVE